MNVRNCKRCHKLFQYIRSPYCLDCQNWIESKFLLISQYLREHPEAGMKELSDQTDTETSILLLLIREGRLVIKSGPELNCERCGATIQHGRFCASCLEQLQRELNKLEDELARSATAHSPWTAGIHIRGRDK